MCSVLIGNMFYLHEQLTCRILPDGMKLYMSDNGVILTEGFNGVVLLKYFAQVAKWRKGKAVPLDVPLIKE